MKRYNAFYFEMTADIQEVHAGGLTLTPSGGITMLDDHRSIRQSILFILSTMPGERIMRKDYGCDLYKLVFSPNDETTAGLAIHYVTRALNKWEKRISLLSVDAGPHPTRPEVLELSILYRINHLSQEDQMTYSFDMSGKEI